MTKGVKQVLDQELQPVINLDLNKIGENTKYPSRYSLNLTTFLFLRSV